VAAMAAMAMAKIGFRHHVAVRRQPSAFRKIQNPLQHFYVVDVVVVVGMDLSDKKYCGDSGLGCRCNTC